jgi:tRNA (guanine-N7-)-methyltransferase
MPADAVRTYYVFFPDPWPKRRHHRRRLFTADLLSSFHRTMEPGGTIHVATDDMEYHAAITGLFLRDTRFVPLAPFMPSEPEQTDFERTFLSKGVAIHRCSYRRA